METASGIESQLVMPAQHATNSRYVQGCRCVDCTEAHRVYEALRLERNRDADAAPAPEGVGRVESRVLAELEGLAQAEARPGLAEVALELARLMDDPRAKNQKPAAAGKLADILDKLRKGADARKSRLASVRQMTKAG